MDVPVSLCERKRDSPGPTIERDPITQAKIQAHWVQEVLRGSTGKSYRVQPAVVFPGWYVDPMPKGFREVWVLNPKALPSFIEMEPAVLAQEDVMMAAYHLSRDIGAR